MHVDAARKQLILTIFFVWFKVRAHYVVPTVVSESKVSSLNLEALPVVCVHEELGWTQVFSGILGPRRPDDGLPEFAVAKVH